MYSSNSACATFGRALSCKRIVFAPLPLCMNYFHSCMPSPACESGTVCTNGVDAGSCCTNPLRNK
ncbi:hypothetical protein ANCDUO_04737 [Ancylostoma duodenale]|uniref:WAP domain-containing protein n=1 Tax=Ancylostoma duodenale TaxID=51022 RepID=A0A0C2D5U8_9BILA|nr:hypothetical protein ANCDUO_04737 [Ancylostoma duodenale]